MDLRHALVFAFALSACSHAQLEKTGDAMVRVERSTQGVVDGISAAKDAVKEDCIAKQLETEAERMACIEDVLAAVRGSKAAVQAVKAALVTFWTLYPVLEQGKKITPADLAELASRADAVYAAYRDLVKYAKEAKP